MLRRARAREVPVAHLAHHVDDLGGEGVGRDAHHPAAPHRHDPQGERVIPGEDAVAVTAERRDLL